jgi:ubiquinone/menaquinone biosynthesis C-methylase UbiE
MDANRKKYKPALSYDWLTPLYDSFIRLTMPETKFKRRLVEQARIEEGQRVLDLGCGTATLTMLIKRAQPGAEVVGLDGDPRILEIAKLKAAKARTDIILKHTMAFNIPYPDASVDRVLSSLVFHHLTRDDKGRTLKEVYRVLRPGGELHVADWGKPQNWLMSVAALPLRMFDGFSTTADNLKGLLPEMFRHEGFEEVSETAKYQTVFGTLSIFQARKPART